MKVSVNTILAKHLANDKIYMWYIPKGVGRSNAKIGKLASVATVRGAKTVKIIGLASVKHASKKFKNVLEILD
ncbi:DUF5839 family protein [Liquorilactobacillus mali]|uniref:Uncharacterized protein n=1 Tax=Liquorilactobacillus mali KCTC 3596 = DSM 20444 TaxID=1046596 RepID=A0A0R2ED91_9LACO|nr:DUF5839 family protein [Liquorilactobacillus mali]KRN10855.1 hypothetical protein FD00_GL002098 [Liquorilactobacillus mali KCTC 3596 = DSM 20444]